MINQINTTIIYYVILAARPITNGIYYGIADVQIYSLSYFYCSNNESSILECSYNFGGTCDSIYGFGVQCQNEGEQNYTWKCLVFLP